MRSVLASLVAVALPAASLAAQEAADSVSLRFGWPAGMAARVEQEWSRVQHGPERRDSTSVRTAYRLRVAAHPEGRLLQVDSFEVLTGGAAAASSGDGAEAMIARLGSFLPSYIVSPDGEFVRIVDLARMQAAMDTLFAPLRAELDSAPPQLAALFANATSAEALTRSAAQEWNLVAGTWVGADWEIGAAYEFRNEEPIPLLPGRTVPMNYEFGAVERVPCTDDATEAGCVVLVMRSAPDSAALAAVMQDFFTAILPSERAEFEVLRNMRTVNELTVVSDPRTLQPYSVELVKLVEVGGGAAGSGAGSITRRLDRRTARYHYGEPGTAKD